MDFKSLIFLLNALRQQLSTEVSVNPPPLDKIQLMISSIERDNTFETAFASYENMVTGLLPRDLRILISVYQPVMVQMRHNLYTQSLVAEINRVFVQGPNRFELGHIQYQSALYDIVKEQEYSIFFTELIKYHGARVFTYTVFDGELAPPIQDNLLVSGDGLLHLACKFSRVDLVRAAITAIAAEGDVAVKNQILTKTNSHGHNALATMLHMVHRPDIAIVQCLLQVSPFLDKDESVQLSSDDSCDFTPFHLALRKNFKEIAIRLSKHCLASRIYWEEFDIPNYCDERAIHILVNDGNLDFLRDMSQHYPVDVNTPLMHNEVQLTTPLHIAVAQGDLHIVKWLVEEGARLTEFQDNQHLVEALTQEYGVECHLAKLLPENFKAQLSNPHVDLSGEDLKLKVTPLGLATLLGRKDIINYLTRKLENPSPANAQSAKRRRHDPVLDQAGPAPDDGRSAAATAVRPDSDVEDDYPAQPVESSSGALRSSARIAARGRSGQAFFQELFDTQADSANQSRPERFEKR